MTATIIDHAPALPAWIERQLPEGLSRYQVETDGQQIHVMEIGQGLPVLLFHGNPTWGFLYRKVVMELTGEPLRLIMPDIVGLGFSSKPRNGDMHRLENHGRWMAAAVGALELDRFILVGQDWGGPIGLLATEPTRDRMVGLVVLNTVLGPPKPGFRPTFFHRFSRLPLVSDAVFRLLSFPQTALHRVQGDPSSIQGDVARAYRHPLMGVGNNTAPLALARMVPDSPEHPSIEPLERCQAMVEAFDGPAAIVWGERDPILGRLLRRTQRLLPNAEVTTTQAGHFLQEEVPVEIAAAIRSVAARIEEAPND